MDEDQSSETPWYAFVASKWRADILSVLEELSRLLDAEEPNFIIIGAFSLLIRGVLPYTAWWDLDLLFRDKNSMEEFIKTPKSPELKIEHLDDKLMVSKSISSLHTVWKVTRNWSNVDYILLPGDFDFYLDNPEEEITFKSEVTLRGREYHLRLPVAAPWDVMVKKLLSFRLQREMENRDLLSVDVRHVFQLLARFGGQPAFWQRVEKKGSYLRRLTQVRANLLRLLALKEEIGYGELKLAGDLTETVSGWR